MLPLTGPLSATPALQQLSSQPLLPPSRPEAWQPHCFRPCYLHWWLFLFLVDPEVSISFWGVAMCFKGSLVIVHLLLLCFWNKGKGLAFILGTIKIILTIALSIIFLSHIGTWISRRGRRDFEFQNSLSKSSKSNPVRRYDYCSNTSQNISFWRILCSQVFTPIYVKS